MELQSALENRKSIRSYLSKDVEPEKLTALIEAASLAPSWKNSQTALYAAFIFSVPCRRLSSIRKFCPDCSIFTHQVFPSVLQFFLPSRNTCRALSHLLN